jgi:hypothetical protein
MDNFIFVKKSSKEILKNTMDQVNFMKRDP